MNMSSFFPESYKCASLKSNRFADHLENLDIPVIIPFFGICAEGLFFYQISIQVFLWPIKIFYLRFQLSETSGVILLNKTELAGNCPDINQELIELCIRGDRVAQYRLYKQYSRTMYNLCIRMVSDKSVAEDLLQEAFVKIFRELHTFRGQSTVGAWLRRIVINQCLNHLRKKRPVLLSLDDQEVPDIAEEGFSIGDISPMEIHRSILNLPEGARVVCVLHLLEGYKHSEISRMLGISESTSKSQYRRAINLLQDKIIQRIYAE